MGNIYLVSTIMPSLLPMKNRSKGVPHVSRIVNMICLRLGIVEESSFVPHNKMSLGQAFEYARIKMYQEDEPGRFVQPGEIIVDGIAGTPDLYDIMLGVVTEIKHTRLSSRHPIDSPKFKRFRWQLKSYVYMMRELGKTDGTCGRLEIMFDQGDYKSGDVDYREYMEIYDNHELDQHWQMIVENKELGVE
jgi:hypothetical protein